MVALLRREHTNGSNQDKKRCENLGGYMRFVPIVGFDCYAPPQNSDVGGMKLHLATVEHMYSFRFPVA